MVVAAVAVVLIISFGAITWRLLPGLFNEAASFRRATFVGSETCAGCHQTEGGLWRVSQHKHAMDHATEQSVLGNFSDASFDYDDVRSRFFRKDGKFFVETDGPDGKLATFEVKYTFGVDPLQQYLIEFPDGRIQALSIAWDSRPKDKGGQRWFHLYPNEDIRSDDVLHWTRLYQNWNFMCAECHSTNVAKGYVAAEDRYETTFSEIDVSCEACHGPGSVHIAWAEAARGGRSGDPAMGLAVVLKDPAKGRWIIDPATGLAQRDPPRVSRAEVEACGRCHARRSVAAEYAYGVWSAEVVGGRAPRPLDLGTVQGNLDAQGAATLECAGGAAAGTLQGPALLVARAAVAEAGSGRTTVAEARLPVHPEP